MKTLFTIVISFFTISTWANHQSFRLDHGELEAQCSRTYRWSIVDKRVSDFKAVGDFVAYRTRGKLYFYNHQTRNRRYIEKRVTAYEISNHKQLVFVHDRDLYLNNDPGSERSRRLKGNITSFQLSHSGVLGFVDDGDLYMVTQCQNQRVVRLKGNISSYEISNDGLFAFVDDGELFYVSDNTKGKIQRLTKRVRDYYFDDRGRLIYSNYKGSYVVDICPKTRRLHSHRKR
ncbi:MAG: hypothetical protein NE330_18425 [Lentisphaeraceae bacterium]|nr:hypothetical protein [Lentisphaeraceae bacterium]